MLCSLVAFQPPVSAVVQEQSSKFLLTLLGIRVTRRMAHSQHFIVYAGIVQDPKPYDANLLLFALAPSGARCTVHVTYHSRRKNIAYAWPVKVVHYSQPLWWGWLKDSAGSNGIATVTCALGGKTGMAQLRYLVTA
jgi:hypothetical protein